MPVDIGPKIGIDGEAEFRKELNNINQQIKTLGSEMKAVTSAFDAGDKSEEALAAQTGVLTRQIEAQEQKLAMLQKGLAASAEKYGENDARTLRWAQAVNDATAELNSLKTKLSQASSELSDLGEETDDVVDALEEAKSAGSGFGDTLKGAILGGGIVSGIQSLAGGVKDLVESTAEYRKIQASLEVSSQQAGYSAEETAAIYSQLYGVLGDDQTAATATANLQAIGLEQEQLTQLTNAAIGAWASYGDSIPIDGLSEAINETIKVGKVTGTFADALNWAGVSEDAFNEKLEAASTPAERANLVLQQLANQGLVQAGEAWQQNNADIVAINQSQASLNDTMAGFGEILSPVVANAKQGFSDLLGGVLSVVQAFQSDGLSGALEQAGVLIGQFVEAVKTNAPQMLAASQEMMEQLLQGVIENIPNVIVGFAQTVTNILDFLAEHLPDMIRTGGEMLGSFAQGVVEAIPDMVQQLPKVIASFVNFIAENLPAIADAGIDLIGGLIKGLLSAIPDLIAALPEIIAAIVTGIGALMGSVVEVGANIVEGIWEGIQGMAKWITDKVTSFFSGIVDGVKEFLGIHSPSTVFETQIGKYMAQGIGVGFEDEMDSVAARMQRSIPVPTIDTVNNAAAGMVNGLSTMAAGQSFPSTIVLRLENGAEVARWLLPDLRRADQANPEVVSGV